MGVVSCQGCRERDARIAELEAKILELERDPRVGKLEAKILELEGKLRDLTDKMKPPQPPRGAPSFRQDQTRNRRVASRVGNPAILRI